MVDLKNKKHLFFDLDDTLWDFNANSGMVLETLFNEFRLSEKLKTTLADFLANYRKVNLEIWSRYYKREVDKQFMRNYRFHEVFKIYGYDNYDENLIISEQYLKRAPFGTILKKDCIDVLTYLYSNYKLHIITNGFIESQAIKLDGCGLRPFFKNIIVSDEHALIKPEEKIFRLAETLSAAAPHECVMIGDSLESDVMGAINAGWDAIYVVGESEKKYEGICINDLLELKKLF